MEGEEMALQLVGGTLALIFGVSCWVLMGSAARDWAERRVGAGVPTVFFFLGIVLVVSGVLAFYCVGYNFGKLDAHNTQVEGRK